MRHLHANAAADACQRSLSSPWAGTDVAISVSIPISTCSFSSRGPIGAAEETFLRAFLHPLWDLGVVVGHQVRELTDFGQLETDNPEFLLALLDARPVAGERDLFDRFTAVFHSAATRTRSSSSRCSQLIEERHAAFNGTLYQLQPDVKEAPGALRDLTATRTIAMLTDPLLLRRGPADPARFDDAEDFLLRVRSTLHLEGQRNQNILSHELQERTAEVLGYPGAEPRHAGRAADERLLPPCADRQPVARVGPQDGADARRAQSGALARRDSVSRPDPGRPESRDLDARRSTRPSTAAPRSARRRSRAFSSTSIGTAPTTSSRSPPIARRCCTS